VYNASAGSDLTEIQCRAINAGLLMSCGCHKNKALLAEARKKAEQDKLLKDEEIQARDIGIQNNIIAGLQEVLGLLEGKIGKL